MMDDKIKAIVEKFDNDLDKARKESRGQEKVLINMYCGR